MAVYREDLRWPPLRCEAPGCRGGHQEEDLWFHPVCHRASPTWVRRRGDVLTLACARCARDVVSLVVTGLNGRSAMHARKRGGQGEA